MASSSDDTSVFFRFGARFGFMYALLLQVQARGNNSVQEQDLQARLDALRYNIISKIITDPVIISEVLQQLNNEIDILYEYDPE